MWHCKNVFDIDKNTFEIVLKHLCKTVREKQMMSVILHESWFGEVVAGWDCVRKLNAFKEHYLTSILLL